MAVFHLSLALPRTAGIWHSIRSSPGPVLWFHSEKASRLPLCIHLAICQHLLREPRQWQHTQGTAGITGDQSTATVLGFLSEETLCLPTLGLFKDPGGGGGKTSLIGMKKVKTELEWWSFQEVKHIKWQTKQCGQFMWMLISVWGSKNKCWNQQLWWKMQICSVGDQILVTLHHTTSPAVALLPTVLNVYEVLLPVYTKYCNRSVKAMTDFPAKPSRRLIHVSLSWLMHYFLHLQHGCRLLLELKCIIFELAAWEDSLTFSGWWIVSAPYPSLYEGGMRTKAHFPFLFNTFSFTFFQMESQGLDRLSSKKWYVLVTLERFPPLKLAPENIRYMCYLFLHFISHTHLVAVY